MPFRRAILPIVLGALCLAAAPASAAAAPAQPPTAAAFRHETRALMAAPPFSDPARSPERGGGVGPGGGNVTVTARCWRRSGS